MADEKKYPWIKSIFHRKPKPSAEGVYSGPEMMSRRGSGKDASVKCVYAGPEMMRRPKSDAVMEDVYAGPEIMERSAPEGPEEEAPPVPEEEKADELIPKDLPKPPPEMMMCVYAGPEYFNPQPGPALGVKVENIPPEKPWCKKCGALLEETDKFCPNCGEAVPKEEEK